MSLERWTPTSERLPDEGEQVLIYVIDDELGKYMTVACRFTDNPPDAWSTGAARIYDGVTHWMPLPEPPQAGN